jgi:dolichol phosphate-mannose mannosyltransferase
VIKVLSSSERHEAAGVAWRFSLADRSWWYPLVGIAMLAHAVFFVRAFIEPNRPAQIGDAAFFQHAGWLITQGAVPYVHIFDAKPPLIFETTAILALLAGGDMLTLQLLSVLLTMSMAIGSIMLVASLAYQLTQSRLAALTAGLVLLSVPGYTLLGALGIREKYFMLFCGLLAVSLQLRGRAFFAGALAALSVGYLQLGIVFPVLVIGLAIQHGGLRPTRGVLGGMAAATAVMVLPIVLYGAALPMLVESVLVPLVATEPESMPERVSKFFALFQGSIPFLPAGLLGIAWTGVRGFQRIWWVALGTVLFLIQAVFLDLNGRADLFAFMAFLALGVGLLSTGLPRTLRVAPLVTAGVLIVAVVVIWPSPVSQYTAGVKKKDGEQPAIGVMYWNKLLPETCYYRRNATTREWVKRSGGNYQQRECGGIDDARKALAPRPETSNAIAPMSLSSVLETPRLRGPK